MNISKYNIFDKNSYSSVRNLVQIGFLLTVLYIGYIFFLFVGELENGIIPTIERPPGVEGFLPISAMVSLKYFFFTGVINDVHPSGLFILLFVTILSLIVKKSFCSWICPLGFISEMFTKLHLLIFKKPVKVYPVIDYLLRGVKYVLLGFFVWSVFFKMNFFSIKQFLYSSYNVTSDIKMLKLFTEISPITLIILIAILILSVLLRNFWCRYLCPYGAYLGIISFLSPVKVRRNTEKCTSCGKCDKNCPSSITVSSHKTVFSDECFSCGTCIDVCPEKDTLKLSLPERVAAFKPALIVVLAVLIFGGGSLAARTSGMWQNSVTTQQYFSYMLENGLINLNEVDDLPGFIKKLDKNGKRQVMMQMIRRGKN